MAGERTNLYLVDGSGYIFRAFFALPQLSSSRGLPTNAVYGFLRMLLKLLKEARPTHIAVVFDSEKKTFRDDLFESYKANRAPAPDELKVQIPFIHRAVEAFRIPRIVVDGFEADDVLGTLAAAAARERFEVVIVTGDKDFMQLVGPHTTLWDTMRDRHTGPREVRERFGVEPHALIDVMALMGDPIDNIKGVPGIGEKTAAALIREFEDLPHLFSNLDRVATAKVPRAKSLAPLLSEHRADVELARKLVEIDTRVPLQLRPEDLGWPGIDQQAVAGLLGELEFNSLIAELAPQAAAPAAGPAAEAALAPEEVERTLAELSRAPRIALHLGEDGAGAPMLKLYGEGQGRTVVLRAQSLGQAAALLGAEKPGKSCHDLKGHLRRLRRLGLGLAGVDFDTMLAGFLVNPDRPEPSLADLYQDHLAPVGGSGGIGPEPEMVAALRGVLTVRLGKDELQRLFSEIELPIARILAEMEELGVAIDARALEAISREFAGELSRLERECFELAGKSFNLNSPLQIRELLFEELKLSPKGIKKTKSGLSTDADALEKLAEHHPLPRKLLEYRAIAKLKSTYSDALPRLVDPATGRLHTSFHQALTATGRLSSTEPNLQNIPVRGEEGRRIRRAFVAPKGFVLLSADYSQIDLRVLAHLSADPTLVEAFCRGEDIHVRTATELLGLRPEQVDERARRLAKTINFGIIYGMGPRRLAGELGIPLEEASDYIKRYFDRLAGVRAYIEQTVEQARERGFVATLYGRRRYLPGLNSPDERARAQAERVAVNTPIQGTAADLIKLAMIRLDSVLKGAGLGAQMVLQVHDELLLQVEEQSLGAAKVATRREMEGVGRLRVPVKVDLKWGENWAEMDREP